MPTYEICIDGKPRKVEIAKNGQNSFTVKVDGKPVTVQMQTDRVTLEKPFSLSIDGRSYQIDLPAIDQKKPFQVRVDGTAFKTELKMPTTKTGLTNFAPTHSAPARKAVAREQVVEGAVTAPMTGKIVLVKVKKGDQVRANQVLCVIEAMKMENEICAPKAGSVQQVNVTEGLSVSEGDILLVIG
jgi:biotin carboxyl carrier protein